MLKEEHIKGRIVKSLEAHEDLDKL